MKKYSTEIAARKLVSQRIALGTSRHVRNKMAIEVITSVGTARNHRYALKCAADWLIHGKGKHLKNMNAADAQEYLSFRATTVGQSAVDLGRQAINFHLLRDAPIAYVPSIFPREVEDRGYTDGEIRLLLAAASPRLNFSIQLAMSAGLRALELVTLAPPDCLNESERDAWHAQRFLGRQSDIPFVVHGKGGLRRQVRLSPGLASELFQQLRFSPVQVRDREIYHTSHFDLIGGANFSIQFSNLSEKVLGTSHGAHGLRHTFAQRRLHSLLCLGLSYEDALQVLSNELGHFSTSNTLAYLRN